MYVFVEKKEEGFFPKKKAALFPISVLGLLDSLNENERRELTKAQFDPLSLFVQTPSILRVWLYPIFPLEKDFIS